MTSAPSVTATATLYRKILRACRSLPRETQDYYRRHAIQSIRAFEDETDVERVASLIAEGERALDWVINKYRNSSK